MSHACKGTLGKKTSYHWEYAYRTTACECVLATLRRSCRLLEKRSFASLSRRRPKVGCGVLMCINVAMKWTKKFPLFRSHQPETKRSLFELTATMTANCVVTAATAAVGTLLKPNKWSQMRMCIHSTRRTKLYLSIYWISCDEAVFRAIFHSWRRRISHFLYFDLVHAKNHYCTFILSIVHETHLTILTYSHTACTRRTNGKRRSIQPSFIY